MKFFKVFLPIFMTFTIICGIIGPILSTSDSISNKVFRLHILANSDSTNDQNEKLKVKDFVLDNYSNIFTGTTLEENIDIAKENVLQIEEGINKFLQTLGSEQKATVSVTKEFFSTRVYDDFTLPAGEYNSLTIKLGEAKGHNWWCIIYPSVCLSACSESMSDYLSSDEMELVSSGYTPKFKIVEIYKKIEYKLKNIN